MDSEISILIRIILFIVLSVPLAILSWKPLHNVHSHGFYRFFAFEGTLIMVFINLPYWITNPFSPLQIFSWFILICSALLVIQGVWLLKREGKSVINREINPENLEFENTTRLVTEGIYKYIRHPMYSSLMLLTWGALLKQFTFYGLAIALVATAFIFATARSEEVENISYFGPSYARYMMRTKMFIPYIF